MIPSIITRGLQVIKWLMRIRRPFKPHTTGFQRTGFPTDTICSIQDILSTRRCPPRRHLLLLARVSRAHHRRSSTLSGLGERLFGRSLSARREEKDEPVQRNGRKDPPTSMFRPCLDVDKVDEFYPGRGQQLPSFSEAISWKRNISSVFNGLGVIILLRPR
jgi:hypothetical protein